jgi:ABC-type transport system substrate-binding protein
MKPVGTGPFVFQSFQADSNYKVVRNNNYWGKDADGNQLPYLDGITTLFSTELTTRVALVKSGQADVMAYEPGKTAADLEALGLKLNGNINSVFWIRFDNANADSPFADKNVREAVAYAIDYDSIAQAFSYGYWKPVHQIAAQDAGATYDPNYTGIPYDVNKAKQLMQEAGKPNGFSCNMMVAPQGVDHDLIVAVQSYLAAINITITLQFPDIAGFFSSIMSPLPPGTLIFEGFGKMGASWNAGLAFGANPTGTYYVSFLKTDKYIELYNATMNSPKEDVTLVKNLLDYLQNEFYVVPIAGGGKGWATQPYVKDAGFNTRSWLPWWTFEKCWLDK